MSPRLIAPDFSFRFDVNDIEAAYGSSEAAFSAGDFVLAAQFAKGDGELKGCALVLAGLLEQGLTLLERQTRLGGAGQLCRAFALWSLDRPAEAAKALATIADPEYAARAQAFAALLARDEIVVFLTGALIPIFAEQHSPSMLAPVHRYGPITAKYVASQMAQNAYAYSPAEPFDEFIAALPARERPDLLFALSPQWLLAKNFHKVTQPKVVWCHDTDEFLYRNRDNFRLYDVAISGCSQEHFEMSRGAGIFCASNIMSNPLNMPAPKVSAPAAKDIDIVFTGSAFDVSHPEKARFLYQLAGLGADYNIKIVNGYLPEKDYFALLRRTKFMPAVGRHAGNTSPRWRDALANGAFLLYPAGTLYGEAAPGCFPYRAGSVAADIRRHLERFDAGDPAYDPARSVAEVNARFALYRQPREKIFERLLKYAVFMALVWRQGHASAKDHARRLVWLTPSVDVALYGRRLTARGVAEFGDGIDASDLQDAKGYNAAAQFYGKLALTVHEAPDSATWAEQAEAYFKVGMRIFPKSLVLHFNYAHWEYFRTDDSHMKGALAFERIIERFDRFDMDAVSDFAWPYALIGKDQVFPTFAYADAATRELVGGSSGSNPVLRSIVLSACYGYIAWSKLRAGDRAGALKIFDRAIAVFPDGLPVLRLYLDTLIDHCHAAATPRKSDVAKLADVAFRVTNIYPAVLLTRGQAIVPLLADNAETDAARELLAAWYRLDNVVHELRPADAFVHRVNSLIALYRTRTLLPPRLLQRVDAYLNGRLPLDRLSQLEQTMVAAARLDEIALIRARQGADKSAAVDDPAGADLYLASGRGETVVATIDPAAIAEADRLRQELNAVYTSRSWRVTAPLRRAGRLRRAALATLDAYQRGLALFRRS